VFGLISASSYISDDRAGELPVLSILIVDDEDAVRETLMTLLEQYGYGVSGAATVTEALRKISEDVYDLILTDLKMDDMNGMDVLRAAKQTDPSMEIIVLTGYGTVESAVEAMKLGAFDYIMKPVAPDELPVRVERALGRKRMTEEIEHLRERLRKERNFDTIIAESEEMQKVLQFIAKVAESDSPIMIQGESGTGKELLARAIHSSGRPNGSFVPVNCSALPETLLESELFGYMRGAFTGATVNRKGLFEEAHHGTLFMDEIGDMAAPTQVKLLRALDLGEIRRVGSNIPVYVDARLVTATNKDIGLLVREGIFREELYYRLNVIFITIPPLRRRRDDILPLAEHFLRLYSSKMNKEVLKISPEARQFMVRYDWPGNVRELENAMERAVVLAQHDTISLDDLPFDARFQQPDILQQASRGRWDLRKLEKEYILSMLAECSGNHSQTAERLGIARNTLWRKLKEYGVS
jgi:DNA-binding NtrC family response regulator